MARRRRCAVLESDPSAHSSVDRALASGARGRRFESCCARQVKAPAMRGFLLLLGVYAFPSLAGGSKVGAAVAACNGTIRRTSSPRRTARLGPSLAEACLEELEHRPDAERGPSKAACAPRPPVFQPEGLRLGREGELEARTRPLGRDQPARAREGHVSGAEVVPTEADVRREEVAGLDELNDRPVLGRERRDPG